MKYKKQQRWFDLGSSLLSGGAQLGAAGILSTIKPASKAVAGIDSDKNMKEPVDYHAMIRRHMGFPEISQEEQMAQEGPARTEKFMDTLQPQSYEYKPSYANEPNAAHGPQVGVMAQDLEKTPEGKSAVHDSPEGKIVDPGHLAMMLAGAVGDLHQRLQLLESYGRREPGFEPNGGGTGYQYSGG